jgi:hypothetical protein
MAAMWMIAFIFQQLGAGRQLMPAHFCHVLNSPFFIPKGAGLIECQVIHANHFGSAAEWYAIPTEQARDLQIPRVIYYSYQNE